MNKGYPFCFRGHYRTLDLAGWALATVTCKRTGSGGVRAFDSRNDGTKRMKHCMELACCDCQMDSRDLCISTCPLIVVLPDIPLVRQVAHRRLEQGCSVSVF